MSEIKPGNPYSFVAMSDAHVKKQRPIEQKIAEQKNYLEAKRILEQERIQQMALYEAIMGSPIVDTSFLKEKKEIRTEPILGKRMWDVDKDGFLAGRTAASKRKKWEKVETAYCYRREFDRYHYNNYWRGDMEEHVSPVFKCTCGIYCFFAYRWELDEKDISANDLSTALFLTKEAQGLGYLVNSPIFDNRMAESMLFWGGEKEYKVEPLHKDKDFRGVAFGYVNAWGRIVEHYHGFRCRYAQIQRIILPCGTPEEMREKISFNYDCDVSVLDSSLLREVLDNVRKEEKMREAANIFRDLGWLHDDNPKAALIPPEVSVVNEKGSMKIVVSPSKYEQLQGYFKKENVKSISIGDIPVGKLSVSEDVKKKYKRKKPE